MGSRERNGVIPLDREKRRSCLDGKGERGRGVRRGTEEVTGGWWRGQDLPQVTSKQIRGRKKTMGKMRGEGILPGDGAAVPNNTAAQNFHRGTFGDETRGLSQPHTLRGLCRTHPKGKTGPARPLCPSHTRGASGLLSVTRTAGGQAAPSPSADPSGTLAGHSELQFPSRPELRTLSHPKTLPASPETDLGWTNPRCPRATGTARPRAQPPLPSPGGASRAGQGSSGGAAPARSPQTPQNHPPWAAGVLRSGAWQVLAAAYSTFPSPARLQGWG